MREMLYLRAKTFSKKNQFEEQQKHKKKNSI